MCLAVSVPKGNASMKQSCHLLIPIGVAFLFPAGCGPRQHTSDPAKLAQRSPSDGEETAPAYTMQGTVNTGKIFIDSVPRGAVVYSLSGRADGTAGDKQLGVTPLVVHADTCPTKKFCIMMVMSSFLQQVRELPDLREWVTEYKSKQYFGDYSSSSDLFSFDSSEVSTHPVP